MTAAAIISGRVTGGGASQPRMKANPVKTKSCQANGLKNQGRSDQGSSSRRKLATSQMATIAAIASLRPPILRNNPMTTGIIARMAMYMGRMSK